MSKGMKPSLQENLLHTDYHISRSKYQSFPRQNDLEKNIQRPQSTIVI